MDSITKCGIHIFIIPATFPIFILSVTRAMISLGDIICTTCELVSIFQASDQVPRHFAKVQLKAEQTE